ncbi:MAG: hypothetical protein ACYCW6_31890, partial [Candidatus Xenobia bacterium]
ELDAELWTGFHLDDAGLIKPLEPADFPKLIARRSELAEAHARVCQYPAVNLWLRAHPKAAPKS